MHSQAWTLCPPSAVQRHQHSHTLIRHRWCSPQDAHHRRSLMSFGEEATVGRALLHGGYYGVSRLLPAGCLGLCAIVLGAQPGMDTVPTFCRAKTSTQPHANPPPLVVLPTGCPPPPQPDELWRGGDGRPRPAAWRLLRGEFLAVSVVSCASCSSTTPSPRADPPIDHPPPLLALDPCRTTTGGRC